MVSNGFRQFPNIIRSMAKLKFRLGVYVPCSETPNMAQILGRSVGSTQSKCPKNEMDLEDLNT